MHDAALLAYLLDPTFRGADLSHKERRQAMQYLPRASELAEVEVANEK